MILVNLSEILGRKRLKISKVIEDTGISRPTLTKLYYNDSKGINFDTLSSLCEYLSISPNDLLSFYNIDIKTIEINFSHERVSSDNTLEAIDIEGTIAFKQIEPLSMYGNISLVQHNYCHITIIFDCSNEYYKSVFDENYRNYIERILIKEIEDRLYKRVPESSIASLQINFSE